MMTLDGVPLIYNGMEVGDTTESGAPALFEKLPIFWAIAERRPEFPRFYKQLLALRHESVALRRGTLEWLRNSDEARVMSFVRRTTEEEMLVVINLSSVQQVVTVEADGMAGFIEVGPDTSPPLPPDAPAIAETVRKRKVGLPAVSLNAWGYRIFRRDLK
jgi:glycosidase